MKNSNPISSSLKRLAISLSLLIVAAGAKASSPDTIYITEPAYVKVCTQNHFSASFHNYTGTFIVKMNDYVVLNTNDTVWAVCPIGGSGVNPIKVQIDSQVNCSVTPLGLNK